MRKNIFAFVLLALLAVMPFSALAQGGFEIDRKDALVSGENVLSVKFSGEYKNSLLNAKNIKLTDKNQNSVKILKTYFDFSDETLYITLGESFSAADEYTLCVDKKVFGAEEDRTETFAVSDGVRLENGIEVLHDGNNYTFSAKLSGGENIKTVTFVCTMQNGGEITDTVVKNFEYSAQNEFSLECLNVSEESTVTAFVNVTDSDGNIITCGRIEQ